MSLNSTNFFNRKVREIPFHQMINEMFGCDITDYKNNILYLHRTKNFFCKNSDVMEFLNSSYFKKKYAKVRKQLIKYLNGKNRNPVMVKIKGELRSPSDYIVEQANGEKGLIDKDTLPQLKREEKTIEREGPLRGLRIQYEDEVAKLLAELDQLPDKEKKFCNT